MAFGFGLRECLGQFLARQELTIALSVLVAGLEGLRLVEPPASKTFRGEARIYGFGELKAIWRQP